MSEYPKPWEVYNPQAHGVYGPEAKCWEHAVFDAAGNQVGNSAKGHPGYSGRSASAFAQYGLTRKVRQFKEFVPPAPRKKPESERAVVRIETFDENGQLTDLTVETRMVYKNSKGKFIKTRSSGSPRITHERDGIHYIVYRPVKVIYGRGPTQRTRIHVKPMTPEEWEAAGRRVIGHV
jgi:hypothetical protein